MQRDLQSLGLYKGRIDGIIGPKSMEAIRAAEEKGYIVTDGKVVKHWIPKKKTAQQKAQNAKPTEELNKNLSWW